jgi:hypothetical protein
MKYVIEKNLPIFHIDSFFDTSLINDSLSNIFDNFQIRGYKYVNTKYLSTGT